MIYWKLPLTLLLIITFHPSYAVTFENLTYKNFKSEKISEKHLRFHALNGELQIHLQILTPDTIVGWDDSSLNKDVTDMFATRRSILEKFGFKEVTLLGHRLQTINSRQHLILDITYKKLSGRRVYTQEINIYRPASIVQLKLISETEKSSSPFSLESVIQVAKELDIERLEGLE